METGGQQRMTTSGAVTWKEALAGLLGALTELAQEGVRALRAAADEADASAAEARARTATTMGRGRGSR